MFYDDVRPAGAYDHMEAFINRRRSPAHSDQSEDPLLGFSPGQPGPVMKVRFVKSVKIRIECLRCEKRPTAACRCLLSRSRLGLEAAEPLLRVKRVTQDFWVRDVF